MNSNRFTHSNRSPDSERSTDSVRSRRSARAADVTLRGLAACCVVSLGMIVGFLLSRTVGLPDGYDESGRELPHGPLSLLAEGLFVVAFPAWLARRTRTGTAPGLPLVSRSRT